MRTIERRIKQALEMHRSLHVGNTRLVCHLNGQWALFLFGNKIAWHGGHGPQFCLCGHNTLTTKSRLRNIFGLYIYSEDYCPMWNTGEHTIMLSTNQPYPF